MDNKRQALNATTAKIIAMAFISSQFLYVVISVVLVKLKVIDSSLPEDVISILGPIFLLVGITSAGASILLRNVMSSRAPNDQNTFLFRFRMTVICLAIAEIGGVLGLIHSMLTQQLPIAIALFAISITTCIFLFPTTSWLENK